MESIELSTVRIPTGATKRLARGDDEGRLQVVLDHSVAGSNVVINNGQILNNATSSAYEASRIIKAAPGILYGITGYSSKTSKQYILFFDSATLPADGTAAIQTIVVAADESFSLDFGENGRNFANGIVFCNSSTPRIKTLGSADCTFDAQVL